MRRNALIIMLIFILSLAFFLSDYMSVLAPPKNSLFKVSDQSIYKNINGRWEAYPLYGVNVNAGIPGAFPGEDLVDKEVYAQWLMDIGALGMNSVRVLDLMPEPFYEAVYEYNEASDAPIYILQGIRFDEVRIKQGVDPLSKEERAHFKDRIEDTINAVHGNPSSKTNIPFFDSYTLDVSKYIIGFCIGPEWQSHDVVYSELMNDPKAFDGTYFKSGVGASAFEAYMAEMLDYVVTYEEEKYDVQHLVSFLGSIGFYQDKYVATADGRTVLLEKESSESLKSYIDGASILPKDTVSGFFISYNVYQEEPYNEAGQSYDNIYEKLVDLHRVPVIISEYGYPSSRLATDYVLDHKAYISEEEQGQRIVNSLDKIEGAACAGSFLMEWQDSWFKSAWNTRDRKILDSSPYWSDAQTYSQSYGLIAYEPRKDDRAFYPDGLTDEWLEEDRLSQTEGLSLSVAGDEKFLYLLLEDDLSKLEGSSLFIDIDTTGASGSRKSQQFGLSFESPVDFVLELEGKTGGRLWVHEYYNTYRFEKSLEELKRRPDIITVQKDMDVFSPIIIDVVPRAEVLDYGQISPGQSVETGQFNFGNANPESLAYVSYSDYFIKDRMVEIRIPWGLLNFMDPSKGMIHGDYYDLYHIEPKIIEGISLGVSLRGENGMLRRLPAASYELEGWVKPSYEKRYKKAYEQLIKH